MNKDILKRLRYVTELPAVLRSMDGGMAAIWQHVSEAADEIERLRNEIDDLRSGLKESTKDTERLNYLLSSWHIDLTGRKPVFSCFCTYEEASSDNPREVIDNAIRQRNKK